MQKILIAADGSKHSQKAVAYIVTHREQFGAHPEIQLMHVRAPLPARAVSALGRKSVDQHYEEETRTALASAMRALDKVKLEYNVVPRVGDTAKEIAEYAEKGRFTLLVMGSHGHGRLAGMALGSTVDKVLAQCRTPVLIVR